MATKYTGSLLATVSALYMSTGAVLGSDTSMQENVSISLQRLPSYRGIERIEFGYNVTDRDGIRKVVLQVDYSAFGASEIEGNLKKNFDIDPTNHAVNIWGTAEITIFKIGDYCFTVTVTDRKGDETQNSKCIESRLGI